MSNPLFDSKEVSCEPFSTPAKLFSFAYMISPYIYIYKYHIRQYGYAEIGVNMSNQSRVQKTCPKQITEESCNDIRLIHKCHVFFLLAVGKTHCRIPSSNPQCLDPAFPNMSQSVDQETTDLATPKASISSVSNLLGASEMFELVGTLENQTLT